MPSPSEHVATAVANTEARRELCAIAGEQAALRRVATLVAEATPPGDVFAAVAEEIGRLLPADIAVIVRYHGDGTITGVAGWTRTGQPLPLNDHLPMDGRGVTGSILKDGRPARCGSMAETGVGILYLTPNSVAGLSVMPTMSAAVTGSSTARPK